MAKYINNLFIIKQVIYFQCENDRCSSSKFSRLLTITPARHINRNDWNYCIKNFFKFYG